MRRDHGLDTGNPSAQQEDHIEGTSPAPSGAVLVEGERKREPEDPTHADARGQPLKRAKRGSLSKSQQPRTSNVPSFKRRKARSSVTSGQLPQSGPATDAVTISMPQKGSQGRGKRESIIRDTHGELDGARNASEPPRTREAPSVAKRKEKPPTDLPAQGSRKSARIAARAAKSR